MRIDKFINSTNLTKRRSVASDMLRHGIVFLNGAVAKPAKDVKVGDVIEIKMLDGTRKYEVLKIPAAKSISKSLQGEYVKVYE
ncbi:MAG: S4 domain-containing protein [Helicobacteraceae bacterium]